MKRKVQLVNGSYYHVFNRSISAFKIFNNQKEYYNFINSIIYYQYEKYIKYSAFKELTAQNQKNIVEDKDPSSKLVSIVSYCLMQTHFHLLISQSKENGIVDFISTIQNSYSKYFNKLHKRKGPLWEGRFKAVEVTTDEQLLHLTRYIHLNPTSANIVESPEDWNYSSYKEYIDKSPIFNICEYKELFDMNIKEYRNFVNSRKMYQQELSIIKSQMIDNYSG